ncbi:MAG TPA: ribosome maturation factor RimM [Pyrinomonadaceae bacterium]|nr:ribosome maturation factor RimM [Pyrinomonadaceae bacterium]
MSEAADDLIVVARVARTRGLRGEVVADLYTDFPGRFEDLDSVIAIAPDGNRRSLQIEEHWFQGNRIIFKFAGYDSIDAAKELAGFQLGIPESERIELPEDTFYDWELAGCRVEALDGKLIGQVREIMRTGGVEILVVAGDEGREFLIPMAHDICVEIDIERKIVRVDPPDGLLEL